MRITKPDRGEGKEGKPGRDQLATSRLQMMGRPIMLPPNAIKLGRWCGDHQCQRCTSFYAIRGRPATKRGELVGILNCTAGRHM
jgi:hypothetical protein